MQGKPAPEFVSDPTNYRFSSAEDAFLEELERTSFRYFLGRSESIYRPRKRPQPSRRTGCPPTASIAATGFGLTALCIADHRGWEDRKKIRERVRNTLRFAATRLSHVHGFFFHFLNMQSGDRDFQSEVSSIDTSISSAGRWPAARILTMRRFATWPRRYTSAWIGVGCCREKDCYRWGWKPETGFLKARWDHYCELMMIYLLGLGSPTHPLPKECWDAWKAFRRLNSTACTTSGRVIRSSCTNIRMRGLTSRESRCVRELLRKLGDCDEGTQAMVPGAGETISGLQRRPVGHNGFGLAHGYVAWGGPPPMGR